MTVSSAPDQPRAGSHPQGIQNPWELNFSSSTLVGTLPGFQAHLLKCFHCNKPLTSSPEPYHSHLDTRAHPPPKLTCSSLTSFNSMFFQLPSRCPPYFCPSVPSPYDTKNSSTGGTCVLHAWSQMTVGTCVSTHAVPISSSPFTPQALVGGLIPPPLQIAFHGLVNLHVADPRRTLHLIWPLGSMWCSWDSIHSSLAGQTLPWPHHGSSSLCWPLLLHLTLRGHVSGLGPKLPSLLQLYFLQFP